MWLKKGGRKRGEGETILDILFIITRYKPETPFEVSLLLPRPPTHKNEFDTLGGGEGKRKRGKKD